MNQPPKRAWQFSIAAALTTMLVFGVTFAVIKAMLPKPYRGIPTSGTARLFDGTLVVDGVIEFIPTDTLDALPVPIASIKKGRFEVWTFREGDGAEPGEYKVVIRDAVPAIDDRYSDETTTDLSVTIERGKKNVFDLVLDPRPPVAAAATPGLPQNAASGSDAVSRPFTVVVRRRR
jgi:hypothetical protein